MRFEFVDNASEASEVIWISKGDAPSLTSDAQFKDFATEVYRTAFGLRHHDLDFQSEKHGGVLSPVEWDVNTASISSGAHRRLCVSTRILGRLCCLKISRIGNTITMEILFVNSEESKKFRVDASHWTQLGFDDIWSCPKALQSEYCRSLSSMFRYGGSGVEFDAFASESKLTSG